MKIDRSIYRFLNYLIDTLDKIEIGNDELWDRYEKEGE